MISTFNFPTPTLKLCGGVWWWCDGGEIFSHIRRCFFTFIVILKNVFSPYFLPYFFLKFTSKTLENHIITHDKLKLMHVLTKY
jgi:hypothetical protein